MKYLMPINTNEQEVWKDFTQMGRAFQASSFGRIRSMGFIYKDKRGHSYERKCRIVSPREQGQKLKYYYFESGNKLFSIHRAVAKLFVQNPENKPQVNHIDGNDKNNFYKNLEWVSSKENIQHAERIGLRKNKPHGEGHKNSRLNNQTVKMIKMEPGEISCARIGKKYGISATIINRIRRGTAWKHV